MGKGQKQQNKTLCVINLESKIVLSVDTPTLKSLNYCHPKSTVAVVQLVERQIVILVVAGSSPVGHPIFLFLSFVAIIPKS